LQGEQYSQTAQALRDGRPPAEIPGITPAERLLLEFVGTVARHAYRVTDEEVQGLRDAGWTDAQIAEAVYDAALFSLFVRLADAFDIHPPPERDPDGVPAAVRPDTASG
jgi:alkylhydroperoxidase family enzyme